LSRGFAKNFEKIYLDFLTSYYIIQLMKIIAHRGFSGKYPENTMEAFRAAESETASYGLENDVHCTNDLSSDCTSDGVVVVSHDDNLRRVCGVDMRIEDKSLASLQAAYPSLPTLDEYLQWVKSTRLLSVIELKDPSAANKAKCLEEKVISLVKKYSLESRVRLISFNLYSLLICKKLDSSIACGFLYDRPLPDAGAGLKALGIDFLHLYYKAINAEVVTALKQHGVTLNAWTVDAREDMARLEALGVEELTTNRPDVAEGV
jgi:glycerophosphoryl diester phosphodiesterase